MSSPEEAPHPDGWSMLVAPDNFTDFPPDAAIPVLGFGNFIPCDVITRNPNTISIGGWHAQTLEEAEVPLGHIPGIRPLRAEAPIPNLAVFLESPRYTRLTVVRLAGINNPSGHPPTDFRHGRHPDHRGEDSAYYGGFLRIGSVNLDLQDMRLDDRPAADPEYFCLKDLAATAPAWIPRYVARTAARNLASNKAVTDGTFGKGPSLKDF